MSTFNTMYVTGGGFPEKVFRFKNEQSSLEWMRDVETLKGTIAGIFKDVEERGGEILQSDNERLERWVDRVKTWFVGRWTKAYVPGDVRHALNDVEENLNLSVTQWE
jgi:hypothetical protein